MEAASPEPSIPPAESPPAPLRVAVLGSGRGSNLQALLDRFHSIAGSPARIELVVASRPGGVLRRAEDAGVPSVVLNGRDLGPDRFSRALLEHLESRSIDLVVLAGFLQLIPASVIERFRGRIINVHPALLPCFGGAGMYGMRVHEAVIASGARVSGVTVHQVDERYDSGRILAQWPVPVLPGDSAESLAARVLLMEHRLLPAVVEAIAGGEVPAAADPVAFDLVPAPLPPRASIRRTISLSAPS